MDALLRRLADEWNANPKEVGYAKKSIEAYRPKTPKVSPHDPKRLNIRAGSLSKLKKLCLAADIWAADYDQQIDDLENEYDPKSISWKNTWKEWGECKNLVEATALQRRWRYTETLKKDLAQLHLYPAELDKLALSPAERDENNAIQEKQATLKLSQAVEFDLPEMLNKVMPHLNGAEFGPVVVALLLATGRRTAEILKTAKFTYVSEYRVLFEGQLKTRGAGEPYEIDLLAPAQQVMTALAWLRKNHDTTNLTEVMVNSKYGKKVKTAVAKACKVNPHNLRGINAVACWKLFGQKQSMMGYLQQQLGHQAASASTARYQTFQVHVKRPWSGKEEVKEEKPVTKEEKKTPNNVGAFGLQWWSVPSKNAVNNIAAMMESNHHITQSSVKAAMGGSHALLRKVFAHADNSQIIDDFNKARIAKMTLLK
jgi:integrase